MCSVTNRNYYFLDTSNKKMMTWWQTIIAASMFWAGVANAGAIIRAESVNPSTKSNSIDDLCLTPKCIHAASWILTNRNFSVDPCNDFYEFACGNLNSASIPDNKDMITEISLAEDELLVRLRNLIEGIDKTKVPKHFGLLRTLYDNCMNASDERYLEAISKRKTIMSELTATDGWPVLLGNKWNDSKFQNKSKVLDYLLGITWTEDSENSTNIVPYLFLEEDDSIFDMLRMGFGNDIVQSYYQFLVDAAVAFGAATRAQAESELEEALLLGIGIAKSLGDELENWLNTQQTTRTTVGEFVKKYPSLELRTFIFSHVSPSRKLSDNDTIILACDFDKFEKALSNVSGRALSNWVHGRSIQDKLEFFEPAFQARMRHNRMFPLVQHNETSTWKKCVDTVRSKLSFSLSALYQRKYMTENIMSDLTGIVTNVKQQMHQLLTEADWPDAEVRRVIGHKLDNVTTQIAYLDEYVDDKKLEGFYEDVNLVEGTMASSLRNISSCSTPWYSRGNIFVSNTYYLPPTNGIIIGTAYVTKNLYDIDRPKYLNYGSFGWKVAGAMGHLMSITHVDENNIVRKWKSAEPERKFGDRMQCIVDEYKNYVVEGLGIKLNGYRLAMVSAADNIGIKAAYRAYLHWAGQNPAEKELPGLPYTTKQMFWIGWATAECKKLENSQFRYRLATGSHPPIKRRINGAVADRPEFADDFKCKPGTKMNPAKKCSVY